MSRLTATIQRRDGSYIPLGPAEPADKIGMNITFQGQMPGGQTSAKLTVARDPRLRDLDPYDELIIRDVGGVQVWGGYGVEYPARDGEGPSVDISATGWSTYLKDNAPPPLVPVDRSFGSWGEPPLARKIAAGVGASWDGGYSAGSGEQGLEFVGTSGQQIPINAIAELFYAMPAGVKASRVDYRATQNNYNAVQTWAPLLAAADSESMVVGAIGSGMTLDNTVRSIVLSGARRYLDMGTTALATHTPPTGSPLSRRFDLIAVYGDHGIPLYPNGDDGMQGVLASDLVTWGLLQSCPLLVPEVTPTSFVIPQFAEPDLEDMEALVLKANATEMCDWGCFGRRFVFRPTGSGRTFVVRASDLGVSWTDAGPQGDDMYTRAFVSFADFSGKSVTVGYPGSGADVETAALLDTSNNVLQQRGRHRTLRLSLSERSTVNRATQVVQAVLQEKATLSQRGSAVLTGRVQDSLGVWREVSQVQSGDQLLVQDNGAMPLRIVDNDFSEATDQQSVSLGSTPSKFEAIMERMGVINEGKNL